MNLKKSRSLRGMRSVEPFTGISVSKTLRKMPSFGAKRTKSIDPASDKESLNTEGPPSDASVGSLEIRLDASLDKRDPPSPKKSRSKLFGRSKKDASSEKKKDKTVSKESIQPVRKEKETPKSTKQEVKTTRNDIVMPPEITKAILEQETEGPQEIKICFTESFEVHWPKEDMEPMASPKSKAILEKKTDQPREIKICSTEESFFTIDQRVVSSSKSDGKKQASKTAAQTSTNDSKATMAAQSLPIHAALVAAASEGSAVDSNEGSAEMSHEGSKVSEGSPGSGLEKYYSKLEAAQRKHEEDREYLFNDIATVDTMDDGTTVFSDFTRTQSREVDIDFIIEDDELKREYLDDIGSVDTMDTGISQGERWGTGALDCLLLLCV